MKVKLLRPLDGKPIGYIVEYPDDDAKRLAGNGIVTPHNESAARGTKEAPAPLNKKAPEPDENKDTRRAPKKGR